MHMYVCIDVCGLCGYVAFLVCVARVCRGRCMHARVVLCGECLQEVFRFYDLAVWSQTNWKWLEMKCTELGFLTSSKFHLCFVLDRSATTRTAKDTTGGQKHCKDSLAFRRLLSFSIKSEEGDSVTSSSGFLRRRGRVPRQRSRIA